MLERAFVRAVADSPQSLQHQTFEELWIAGGDVLENIPHQTLANLVKGEMYSLVGWKI